MDVVVWNVGNVKVYYMAQRVNVNPSSGDVRGNQNLVLTRFETRQRFGAGRLGAVAVDALGGNARFNQLLGNAVGAVFGAGEHDDVFHVTLGQQGQQQLGLEVFGNRVYGLVDATSRCRLTLYTYPNRVLEQLGAEFFDGVRHSRREK